MTETVFYLEGEKLSAIRAEKSRRYSLWCDECLKEIKPSEKCIHFEFAKGGSFVSCEKCFSSFMSEVTVE